MSGSSSAVRNLAVAGPLPSGGGSASWVGPRKRPIGAMFADSEGMLTPSVAESRTVTQEPSDSAVVRAVLAGEREAFRLLVRRHQGLLYRHALRTIGSADDAADLVQRAFVAGFNKLDRCEHPERVAGWLFRIASNLCKDFLKDRRRQTVSLDDPDVIPIDWDTPGDRAERREIRDRVGRALAALVEEQREAFMLKHIEGYSYDEMAELTGASVSALKMRVARAREALQEVLEVVR